MDQEKMTFTCPFGTYAYRRMPFGLCNAPATFQRCMLAIFHDTIKESVEVFMEDFSVFGSSFDHCLNNLDKMIQRYKDAHLVLNWEKCHFMVKEGIMLGHKVSEAGLKVDKAKIKVISKLPPPTNIKVFWEILVNSPYFALGIGHDSCCTLLNIILRRIHAECFVILSVIMEVVVLCLFGHYVILDMKRLDMCLLNW
ncbi:reverse transcriptase domain-containing protein [Tanacetum coccineum]